MLVKHFHSRCLQHAVNMPCTLGVPFKPWGFLRFLPGTGLAVVSTLGAQQLIASGRCVVRQPAMNSRGEDKWNVVFPAALKCKRCSACSCQLTDQHASCMYWRACGASGRQTCLGGAQVDDVSSCANYTCHKLLKRYLSAAACTQLDVN